MSSKGNRIINVISNRNDASIKTANLLIEKLSARGFYVPKNYDTNAELNICIGGDGAFLRTVHRYNFPNIPFVGHQHRPFRFLSRNSSKRYRWIY